MHGSCHLVWLNPACRLRRHCHICESCNFPGWFGCCSTGNTMVVERVHCLWQHTALLDVVSPEVAVLDDALARPEKQATALGSISCNSTIKINYLLSTHLLPYDMPSFCTALYCLASCGLWWSRGQPAAILVLQGTTCGSSVLKSSCIECVFKTPCPNQTSLST